MRTRYTLSFIPLLYFCFLGSIDAEATEKWPCKAVDELSELEASQNLSVSQSGSRPDRYCGFTVLSVPEREADISSTLEESAFHLHRTLRNNTVDFEEALGLLTDLTLAANSQDMIPKKEFRNAMLENAGIVQSCLKRASEMDTGDPLASQKPRLKGYGYYEFSCQVHASSLHRLFIDYTVFSDQELYEEHMSLRFPLLFSEE